MKKKFFITFFLFYINFFIMINFSYSSDLDVITEKLSENEKQVIISGFERAYGFSVSHNTIYIPDFITGFIYELNLENKKTKILIRKSKQLKYLTLIEKLTNKTNLKNLIVRPHDIYIDDQSYFYISEMGHGNEKGEGKILVFDQKFSLIKEIGLEMHNNFGLISPIMISKHNDIFYVSENGSNKILRFTKNFEFIDWIGETDEISDKIKNNSWIPSKQFIKINLKNPHAVKIGPNDHIYIIDTGNNRILRFGLNGEFKGWIGKNENGIINNNWSKDGRSIKGDELGAFNNPLDLFIKDNFMYITEVENSRIVKIGLNGKSYGWIGINENNNKFEWTKNHSSKIDLKHPFGIEIKNNLIYIADRRKNRIKIIYSNNLF